jgi:hypothetical protein
MEGCIGQRAAIGLASGQRVPGLDAWRALLLICLFGSGVGAVGLRIQSLEAFVGMVFEASLPLAGFLLASRLSARSDGSPQAAFTLWKAYIRNLPVYGVGLLCVMTLSLKAGVQIQGGGILLLFGGTMIRSRADDLVWAWPVAVVWWGHVVLVGLSAMLRWIPWARTGHRNVWVAGWALVVVLPIAREIMRRLSPLEAADFIHGSVWRLDAMAWGVGVYGILRNVPSVGSRGVIALLGVVGLAGAVGVGLISAGVREWSGKDALLGVVQCGSPMSLSLVLPWLLVWRVPWEVRSRPWLELVARMSYPSFIFFIVVFNGGGGKGLAWIGSNPFQRSAVAGVVSVAAAWAIAAFVQPVLNRLLLGQARRVGPPA